MSEELKKFGLFVDDLYLLRVLEPNVAQDARDLSDESENFSASKFFHQNFPKPSDCILCFRTR